MNFTPEILFLCILKGPDPEGGPEANPIATDVSGLARGGTKVKGEEISGGNGARQRSWGARSGDRKGMFK